MSTKSTSTWKSTAVGYAIAVLCLGGYALTKHGAFLFLYALVGWFAMIAIVTGAYSFWYTLSKGTAKQIDELMTIVEDMADKMKFSFKLVLGYIFSFASMGLLLYWEAYKTVFPMIVLTIMGFLIRSLVLHVTNEQKQSS